jgi:predicted aspartyl protease
MGFLGPQLSIVVGVGAATLDKRTQQGLFIPDGLVVTALIDTGAGITGISRRIIDHLGLEPFDSVPVYTPQHDTPVQSQIYDLSVTLPGHDQTGKYIPELHVIESKFQGEIEVLIGRDVLQQGVMFYDGVNCQYTLAF